jgi:AcrR family transcriptional regulator
MADAPAALARREARGRERQIIAAASRLFVEKGFDGTSMSDIAQAVNITKAGLYHFVPSKEELLFTIVQFGMDRLDEQVVVPARKIADPQARLAFMLRAHAMNAGGASGDAGNPQTIVVDELTGLTPEHRASVEARKRAYVHMLRETLEELTATGRLADGLDDTAATFAAIGAVMWIARWWRPDGRLSLEEVADNLANLVLSGVLASPPAPGS